MAIFERDIAKLDRAGLPRRVRVAVIGTGFAGLATAIRLQQRGIDDFILLERADDVGGTWRDNTYPGCRCDVPSHLYSLSYAPNPGWSESFSAQPEIQSYLRAIAAEHELVEKTVFGAEVTAARWRASSCDWEIETTAGGFSAAVLIAGTGGLDQPSTPEIPGLDDFEGVSFHSARWNHDYDLAGKRVAVVGTGASAIQFVPQIASEVAQLHLFQRTPPWIAPRFNRPITRLEQRLFARLPALQRLARAGIYWSRELLVLGLSVETRLLKALELLARRHLRSQVADPELRGKLTPDYRIGCKRILISNDYYPALTRDNVELLTEGVAEVRGSFVVGSDGSEREVDAIIFGTGFRVTDNPTAQLFYGRDGRSLAEHWAGGMQFHRGTSMASFPNFYMLMGPNTGTGHTSATVMIEAQAAYIVDSIESMEREGLAAVEPTPEAQAAFNAAIDRKMEGTVWTAGGCASWYLDSNGRNSALWPEFSFNFARQLSAFDLDEHVAVARQSLAEREPATA